MKYKVCILTAGAGIRMGEVSNHINKGVLPVNSKAILSNVINKFPKEIEFVIAVGHKKNTVIDYLGLAHPDNKITYVHIDKFVGKGTGPGYSLLQCKKYLNCPFIFITSDTIVLEDIPKPTSNWMGGSPVEDTENYCTIGIKNKLIYKLDDKIKTNNKYAFIGLAGIYNYKEFWKGLEKKEIDKNEFRDIQGFRNLINKKIGLEVFTWFDTGTLDKYIATNKELSKEKFDFSKINEFIYFIDNKVIKFYSDESIVNKRVNRANYLKDLIPKIKESKGNFFCYDFIDGDLIFDVLDIKVLKDFLYWCNQNLWAKKNLKEDEKKVFLSRCKEFYYNKTLQRLERFYEQNNLDDIENNINGTSIPPVKELLSKIKWNDIYNGIPSKFHGDLTLGNILVIKDNNTGLSKFILLDWRQDFGGLIEYGDLYYDLAKIYKGIILSDELIKENRFVFDMSGSSVYFDYDSKKRLIEAKEEFERFIIDNGYDLKKVKILTSLCFLNMSPLHKYPLNLLLYFLGKEMLYKSLKW